jgi:hypothetical protein
VIGEVCVKHNIVRRQFAKVDDKWIEITDLRQRDLTADRTWSSFRLFIPTEQPDAAAATLSVESLEADRQHFFSVNNSSFQKAHPGPRTTMVSTMSTLASFI